MEKILIIDDDRKIRELYRNLLADDGFEVLEAANAVEASAIITQDDIDLIILDIHMPGIDGGRIFKLVYDFDKDIKIIVSSTIPLDEQKKRIISAYDYHDKSEGVEDLRSKIQRALENKKSLETLHI